MSLRQSIVVTEKCLYAVVCRAVKCRYNVKLYCVIAENALPSIEFYCFCVLW